MNKARLKKLLILNLPYSFISRALCQFSKANMVRQYSQKLLFNTSSSKKSVIFLLYSASSGVKNRCMISIAPLSLMANLPSVWASCPLFSVARHRLKLGSFLFSQ